MVTLALETRLRSQVPNFFEDSVVLPGDVAAADMLRQKYPAATHRPTLVTYKYNCHGLTFGTRRTHIAESSDVRKILVDDGYTRINNVSEVLAGDVIVYISEEGDIEHSGVVIANSSIDIVRNPTILSKWGSAHEVIHRVFDCPYSKNVEYYRLLS